MDRAQKLAAGSDDCEALALLFSDPGIIDDGTVPGRLREILAITEHFAIPGLQTRIRFHDRGFKGQPTPGGPGFRDPWPKSDNQVGHFLSAAGMNFQPDVVRREVGGVGPTVRSLLRAPDNMSDREVVQRLVIGHEKAPDPAVDAPSMAASALGGLSGGSSLGAIVGAAAGAAMSVVSGFRVQFEAVTPSDMSAWAAALSALGNNSVINLAAAEPHLRKIPINYSFSGNSIQDLRLSLCGWYLGQAIANRFASREDVAKWVRINLHA
ncbi:hypothetical protein HUT19_01255 [Streptomyces sp. NA02950]|uniref:hypothetical protein n=1 Tax=Streptomyces sp. NA02950 TaxID=2742137 RepID=UPI0015929AEC|nr:hypothetical protein [Streptomyces sp. NA02950]QKV90565.1 hypothetical protein HUT19_01255 [Streptomyces sp. NA02950]